MSTELPDWNFENFHVSSEINPTLFVSSDSTLVAAGPATFDKNTTVYPIGLVENFGLGEGRQVQRIFEIGSALSYFVIGRAIGSLTLGQVFYNGPSLVSALYAIYKIKVDNGTTFEPLVDSSKEELAIKISPGVRLTRGFTLTSMFSDLFRYPTGIMIYHKDSAGTPIGGLYLEQAYITSRQFATTAGAIIIAEGVAIEYTKSVPIEALPTGSSSTGAVSV